MKMSVLSPLGGWSGGAMVLGKLPVPGRPTIWIAVGQGLTALAVGAGGGCLDIFTLFYPFFPLSPSLWETARYRLKYCLKGLLNPKPTNQQPMSPLVLVSLTLRSANLRSPAPILDLHLCLKDLKHKSIVMFRLMRHWPNILLNFFGRVLMITVIMCWSKMKLMRGLQTVRVLLW